MYGITLCLAGCHLSSVHSTIGETVGGKVLIVAALGKLVVIPLLHCCPTD